MDQDLTSDPGHESTGRGWPRAAALLGVVVATSVLHPGVLIAVPLLMLLGTHGLKGFRVVVAVVLATTVVASGSRDGVWFAERAWSVLVGGGFLGLTMIAPRWRLSSRALGAVVGSATITAGVLAVRADAWAALDAAISEGVRAGVDATIAAMAALRGGEALPSALVTTFHEAAAAQAAVFPALVGLESMAALGLVWWIRRRLIGAGDQGFGPLRDFRFNDHLVWLLVGGLLLLVAQWGDAFVRVGSNAVVFMGALYALRGAAVFMFVNGGLSLFGYVMFAFGLLLAAPVVLGVAVLIGVGDTWLDLRARAGERAA